MRLSEAEFKALGRPIIRVELPLKTVSLLNMREHFRVTARRKKLHRECVRLLMRGKTAPPMPVTVTLTRRSSGTLDKHDNLPSSFKNVADELAVWLGVDDADPRVTWRYTQEKTPRGVFGVVVEVA